MTQPLETTPNAGATQVNSTEATTQLPSAQSPSAQWFRGNIEGYYVGKPARPGVPGRGNARGFELVVYRAAISDVELMDFVSPIAVGELAATNVGAAEASAADGPSAVRTPSDDKPTAGTPQPRPAVPAAVATPQPALEAKAKPEVQSKPDSTESMQPPLVLPPWLPAPGTSFFQPTITDARLFPVRHAMGWFEGPVHQVFIEEFRSTHSKQHGLQLYGRFTGRAHGYFALPPAPRPEAAERLVQAFRDLPDDAVAPNASNRDPHANARDLARDHAEVLGEELDARAPQTSAAASTSPAKEAGVDGSKAQASAPANKPADAAAPNPTPHVDRPNEAKPDAPAATAAKAQVAQVGGRVPFPILVILVAAALLLTCGAPRALLWLFFLLPTLLVRRILGGIIPDTTALRGFSALVTVGQAWLAGMVFVGWWETGCRDVHPVPLIGTLAGLVITSILPFDVPLLINASTLAAMLIGWCTGKDACGESAQTLRDASHESPGPALPENRS